MLFRFIFIIFVYQRIRMYTRTSIITIVGISTMLIILHKRYQQKKRVKKYTEYMNMNVKELKTLCYIHNIPTPNKLRKHEMIDCLMDIDNA